MPVELSAHELSLLTVAVPFCQELKVKEDRLPTRDELKRAIFCGSDSAQRILGYLSDNGVVKVAERLQKLPGAAEVKAVTQFSLGDTSGSLQSYVLRENARLVRKLGKQSQEKSAFLETLRQDITDEIADLKILAKQEIKRTPRAIKPKKDTGLLLELATPDLHAGKLAHSAETGGVPYDVKIAVATFYRAIDVLLERTEHFDVSEILLCVGNDLFHTDNPENTTTAGTQVSTDGRFFKTFTQVRTMLVNTIERLREIAKVRVIICPGNHDAQTAFHVGDSLEMYFHGDSRVVIHNEPSRRKYVSWGKCLIGFCHGNEERHGDLPLLMASERPQDWAGSVFREWHTGHFHKLEIEETHGVRVRTLSALCSADDWHSLKGFVNQLRTAQAFIWSKDQGLISEVFYNADADAPIITKREIV